MKLVFKISMVLVLFAVVTGCVKRDTQFKDFLNNKELIYPGIGTNPHSSPGNLRVQLMFNPSPDPSITKYVIYWNNKADSLTYTSTNHNPSDTLKVIVPNLNEYSYSFTVYSYDAQGNRSIPLNINNVKIFGPNYQSGLVNRAYKVANPYTVDANGNVTLNFYKIDTASESFSFAHNTSTTIRYTNRAGQATQKYLFRDSSITITDFKGGSTLDYRSTYVPVIGAIDTFNVATYTIFPQIFGYAACNKSLFAKVKLPYDMNPYEGDTDEDRLWDGSVGPQGYPNIFHSDGAHPLPQTLTFDMGKVYNSVTQIEETGRNCCHNPDNFEVWGIADITNAATKLQPNDPGWADEAIAKGWKLLKTVKRSDDGQAALKVNLDNTSTPVRYVRIRIIHNVDGEGSYTNLSEITMFYNVLN
ncbi:hypothetical protein KXD93_17980 [Mucilaginibacter sp. BJC16-A38]|uniref:DUF4998 domain-containing protein n=1 Tax=Mucilaginibacter phenanthrenivorans TaxID=1234842 RepID=UPI00215759D3|nr:DUF4998 domain-containing protein [Mucilaginibacter phenanthrenivorans]MCR8559552.1 hypothetical protein [Mucilaginibacter phenanthrenivorans]